MAEGLIDIGGGVKMVDPKAFETDTTSDAVKQATGILNLQGLQEQAATAPLRKRALEAEATLKENEVGLLETTNALEKAKLAKAANDEERAAVQFNLERAKNMHELVIKAPDEARAIFPSVYKGGQLGPLKDDGTMDATIPGPDGKGQTIQFVVDPKRLTPEKKQELESRSLKEFSDSRPVQEYETVATHHAILKKLVAKQNNLPVPTAQNDQAIIQAAANVYEPNVRFKEGEAMRLENAGGIPTAIVNLWNRSITSAGPILGPKGSQTRQNFLDTADTFASTRRDKVLQYGRFKAGIDRRSGLDVRNTMPPIGDITPIEFTMTDEEILAKARGK